MTMRKLIAVLLSIILACSLCPGYAFADVVNAGEGSLSVQQDLVDSDSIEDERPDSDSAHDEDAPLDNTLEDKREEYVAEGVEVEGGRAGSIDLHAAGENEAIPDASPQELAFATVDYLFIEAPTLSQGSVQNIVVGVPNELGALRDAKLIYTIGSGSDEYDLYASRSVNGAVLFEQAWSESLVAGEYHIVRFEYEDAEGYTRSIDLSNGENCAYEVFSSEADSGEAAVTAYSLDEDGTLEESEVSQMIEEGINGQSSADRVRSAVPFGLNARASYTTVIALDPGHGGTDPGACYGDLQEKTLNWKVANYCKAQLESYGFRVYLTRSEDECPGLEERVVRAVNNGANFFVSIHMNSATSTSAHGAEVWIQSPSSYLQSQTNVAGTDLGNRILANLASLGLSNRGLQWSNLDSTYPDGSKKDYLGVLRHSRERGLPAVLVEHAFMAGNYSFLSSESNLKRLGEADAEGIASYFNHGIAQSCGNFYVTDRNDFTGTFRVWATDVQPRFLTDRVLIPVWPSTITDSSKIRFYEAKRDANRNYYVDVNVADYGGYRGRYYADCYTIAYGQQKKVAGTIVCNIGNASARTSINSAYRIDTTISNPPSDISRIRYAVWSLAGNQSDLRWIDASKRSATQWGLDKLDIAQFSRAGAYGLDTYAVLADGSLVKACVGSFTVAAPSATVKLQNASSANGTYQVVISGISNPFGTRSVKVPTWTSANGQDDIVWYTAQRQANGSYVATVSVSNHSYQGGQYISHVYLETSRGDLFYVGAQSQSLSSSLKVSTWLDGTVAGLKVSGANWIPSGSVVQFAVWSAVNGQDDLVWLTAGRFGNEWVAGDALSSHSGAGRYLVHAYVRSASGAMSYVGQASFWVDDSLMKYPIMGSTNVTPSQMVACYRASGKAYPADALSRGGASTIDAFCNILYNESRTEGVNAEVLFSQVMVETGWLQFGNDVSIDQFNFGGIGATGNGSAGASFPNVRTGIRAQVQHLKAYGSTAALVQACVDPRFNYVSRGCAPYAEDLQGRWASSSTYAASLRQQINALLQY